MWHLTPDTNLYRTSSMVAHIVIEVIIGVLSVIGNGVVLFLIVRNSQLQTVTNCLIAGLALADLLLGALGVPCVVLTLYGLPRNFTGCLLANSVIITLAEVSIFSLLSVAVERFVAIRFPFFYHQHITIKVAIAAAGFNWIVGLTLGLVPAFGWNKGWNAYNTCVFIFIIPMEFVIYFSFFGFVLTPLILMALIYVYIFRVVKQQAKIITSLQVTGVDTKEQTTKFKTESRAARRFALVIGVFTLCWMPLEILNCISLWSGWYNEILTNTAVWLSHANSAINPFLYAYGSPQLRQAFKQQILCRKNVQVQPFDGTETNVSDTRIK